MKEGVEKERVVYAGGKRGGMKGRMLGEREERGRREGGEREAVNAGREDMLY